MPLVGWPHALAVLYRARCKLVHGEKVPTRRYGPANAHAALDRAVFAAYGGPEGIDEEEERAKVRPRLVRPRAYGARILQMFRTARNTAAGPPPGAPSYRKQVASVAIRNGGGEPGVKRGVPPPGKVMTS